MRRTVVHYVDSEEFGGVERALGHLLEHHDRERWRMLLFHHGAAAHDRIRDVAHQHGVATRVLPRMPGRRGGRFIGAFARALRAERTAVFHAHLNWALGCAWGIVAAAAARVPSIVGTVQLFKPVDTVSLPTVQRLLLPRLVHGYVAVSERIAELLVAELGVVAGRIHVVPNGVPLPPHDVSTAERRAAARQRLFGDVARPIVLTLARLEPQKGHGCVLALAERNPEPLFIVAGTGTLYGALDAEIGARGLRGQVLLLGHRDDTADLLDAADVFLLPSVNEGMPLAILEAMAAGVPVIASAIGGVDETIEHGENGFLCPPGQVEEFCVALRKLLYDAALRERLANAAQERVREHFTADRMTRRVEAVYEELAG